MNFDAILEKGILPDAILRVGIRSLCTQRLKQERESSIEKQQKKFIDLLETLKSSKIAVDTDKANEQHYEVPAEFYNLVLGKYKKYSSCYWDDTTKDLSQAEAKMLAKTVETAKLSDGQRILELGCGWGSLSLYMAEQFPNSKIVAVSNSKSQKDYILQQAKDRNLHNLEVITCDINTLELNRKFDRVVSVEMFEHVRNYDGLFKKIHSFLEEEGLLFIHIFCHKDLAYLFEDTDDTDWMSRYFFTGGIMPSRHLFFYFARGFFNESHIIYNGKHYEKTSNAWLENLDKNREEVLKIFTGVYGEKRASAWLQYWRIFFMAVAELFGYNRGNEWIVSHYTFRKI
ncbi:MAG: class I SAM-dependent methyltransferase, partial [Leptospiraceae bacterium]|nr:class I SAM-dependent methyltransferase [Leptospiraceae bacterium]